MLPRREFLRGLSALSVFSLAGCSDDGEGTDTLTETARPGTETTVPFTVTETLHEPSTATTTRQPATRTTALTTTPATETEASTDMVVAQSDPATSTTSTATQSTQTTTTKPPSDTMTDNVFWQDGDEMSAANLSQLRAKTNSSDYVERGLSFTPDYTNNELDISTGHAVIYDESTDRAYDVFPDARTNLALTDAATNYVYLMCDPDNVTASGVDDDVDYHIDTDDTPPTATETSATTISVKVGEVDTSADSKLELQRAPSIDAESLANVADTIVSTTSELEAAFNNLSAGETVYIGRPATPYRPTQWLDIDVSNVTVKFQSSKAESGDAVVKVADGANVGGIRVGVNATAANVLIDGYGHDGNPLNQTSGVRHHGVIVGGTATNVAVMNGYFTRTHPYQQHDNGGSGISVRPGADTVLIRNNEIEDIGDRGIQLGGIRTTVVYNSIHDGYDRSISMDMLPPNNEWNYTEDTKIAFNDCRTNSDGSIIGSIGRQGRINNGDTVATGAGLRNVSIIGNRLEGGQRRGIFANEMDPNTDGGLSISGNVCVDNPYHGIQVSASAAGPIPVSISGNTIRNPGQHGISSSPLGTTISGNSIHSAGTHGILVQREASVAGNVIVDTGGNGVHLGANRSNVTGNRIQDAGNRGIYLAGGTVLASGNHVEGSTGPGIETIAANRITITGNVLEGNGLSGTDPELKILAGNSVVGCNIIHVGGSGASTAGVEETIDAVNNTFLGNRVDHGTPWSLSGTTPRTMANYPNPDGKGYVVTTPDGTAEYEIAVDNTGAVTTTQL